MLTVFALVPVVIALSGCGEDPILCTTTNAGCMRAIGSYTYRLQTSNSIGSCPFTPYLLNGSPAVTIAVDGTKFTVSTDVLDPASDSVLSLQGDVFQLPAGDKSGAIVTFSMFTETTRLATPTGPELVTIRVTYAASLIPESPADPSTLNLSGSLTSRDRGGEACSMSITFSATSNETTGG